MIWSELVDSYQVVFHKNPQQEGSHDGVLHVPASLAQSCEIDMKHVMSFVARSNLTSIAV